MEAEVTSLRTKHVGTRPNILPISDAILDDCERSFTAAQESKAKSSVSFFDDTGLMALICRHDRVLFMVNLKSTGEKQYYAFALLDALFKELPQDWIIGVLYDIGCQIHRSCEKVWASNVMDVANVKQHNLLPNYRHRIIWGISVFHAYGHQWPCQLTYHPRKRPDFGLSDGEGCERFWSAISYLIPPLRVSNVSR
jgi:hypothetical protein